ncbi:uncharacterized protein LOC108909306 [Anoplophora glabripennis]|uniref:uncharacterized protein LOC108909306 n=1 Tax=Anoplophora glabripennis TaxID=217634 RepID=UPI0008745FB9|nr:uncharacterized protein LOC108909306 [Anoplophora glabripennis]
MSDILKALEDDQISELSEMYKANSDAPPYVRSYLETMRRWKRSGKCFLVSLWSPNDCWREDGTFIALMQFGNYDLFMFTLDPKCENLRKGIEETKEINWKNPTLVFNLHFKHYPYVLEAFRHLNLVANFNRIYDMYFLERDQALKFDLECPSDVYLKKLDLSVAPLIDYLYKAHRHRYPDGEKFISTLIELNGGFGLFSKQTHDLVAWVMRTCLGQIGFLQTVDGHTRKGYGEYLAKVVSREIAEEGFVPMGAVFHENSASLGLFRKLGFQVEGLCYFIEVNK